MAKYAHVLQDGSGGVRRQGGRGFWFLLAAAILCAPIVYDGVRVCVGNWRSMTGSHVEVNTPVFDALSEAYRSASDEWYYRVGRGIEPGQWSAKMAVPAVIAVAIASTFFLKNTTR